MMIQHTTVTVPCAIRVPRRKSAWEIRKDALRNILHIVKDAVISLPSRAYQELTRLFQCTIAMLLFTSGMLIAFSAFLAALNLFISIGGVG